MRLLDKSIHDIHAEDIRNLVFKRKLPESRTLDYKQQLPSDKEPSKKDFLADIAALANTSGGVIVFGVAEETDESGKNTGIPLEIAGLDNFNADSEKLRLDQIIMDGLQPRLKVDFEAVEVDSRWVLLVAVPRSLFAPHIVWFQKSGKFYGRGNAGSYQMDVHQIREAFLQSDSWEKQADNFRRHRLMDTRTGLAELLPTFARGVFIHVVPLGFGPGKVNYKLHQETLMTIKPTTYDSFSEFGLYTGFNIDGYFVQYRMRDKSYSPFYIQYFGNGSTELFANDAFLTVDNKTALDGERIERTTVKWVHQFLSFAPTIGVYPPLMVFVSVLGDWENEIKVFGIQYGGRITVGYLSRRELILPGIVIDELRFNSESELAVQLRPAFDVLWQAAGRAESPHYNPNGTWDLR